MMKIASCSQPVNRCNKMNKVLQGKLKAALDRFLGADDRTKAARKAREEEPEHREAMIFIISDILKTRI